MGIHKNPKRFNLNDELMASVKDYSDLHLKENCKGKFELGFVTNSFLDSTSLGPIKIPAIPMVRCEKCEAAFIVPGFEEWVEVLIADNLVLSNGVLTKKQLRFLRQFLDLTQDELAKMIGVADRHEIAKMESESSQRQMDLDKQLRAKMIYAKLLDLTDSNKLLELANLVETPIKITPQWFDEEEIRKKFAKKLA